MPPKKVDESLYHPTTQLIYGRSHSTHWDYSFHVVPPITASSTFRLESADRGAEGFQKIGSLPEHTGDDPIFVYDRMGEPTINMLESTLATAERGEAALVFGSGMAAVHAAVFFNLTPGAEIISHQTVYGCTYSLFNNLARRCGFRTHFCDLRNPEAFVAYVTDTTRLLYLESPSNPTLDLIDLRKVVELVEAINKTRAPEDHILTAIDNTFATPWCQRPIEFGIDLVIHSLTKNLSGFGTELGGVVITKKKKHYSGLFGMRKDCGGIMSPQTAWHIMVYGLPTLPLRVMKQQENALRVAEYLEAHPLIDFVRYPGLPSFPQFDLAKQMLRDCNGAFAPGGMIFFALKGASAEASRTAGKKLMDAIAQNSYTITLAVSLGQLKTLIEHPGSMTHAAYPAEEQIKLGLHPGGIRLSIGIESPDDIIKDLDRAFKFIEKDC